MSNSFGTLFRITTFGESHGTSIGVVIDGCPANLSLDIKEINDALFLRKPGRNSYTSPRKENDKAQILSGLFEGKTTGAPLTILIPNQDVDSSSYETIKHLYRPGHANYTYLQKYGLFDYRGGGRASARETAARVAAGAVAKKLLSHFDISCTAFIDELGGIPIVRPTEHLKELTLASPIFCPDPEAEKKMQSLFSSEDSLGAIVACSARIPHSLGEPLYQKIEALLASAMLSIPASRGFEIGEGFAAARKTGSAHNDPFELRNNQVYTKASTLGGISTGSELLFRVAFKPTSSIKKPQKTVSLSKEPALFQLPETARHDPCVAIRAVPVVESMAALVFADLLLLNRSQVFSKSSELLLRL